jgi:hypothetical protein
MYIAGMYNVHCWYVQLYIAGMYLHHCRGLLPCYIKTRNPTSCYQDPIKIFLCFLRESVGRGTYGTILNTFAYNFGSAHTHNRSFSLSRKPQNFPKNISDINCVLESSVFCNFPSKTFCSVEHSARYVG